MIDPAEVSQTLEHIRPFRIAITDDALEDLTRRLATTRWAPTDAPESWADGTASSSLRDLVDHWQHHYDWRAEEGRLNSYPQFLTEFDGEDIHFIWLRALDSTARRPPVLLTHGWPGSFTEFLTVATRLSEHGHDVVIPTIPGFGFPGPARRRWDIQKVASVWASLMDRLGYSSYFAHGSDIGGIITRVLGLIDTEHIAGLHLTSIVGLPSIRGRTPDELTSAAERAAYRYAVELSGYAHLQATRPLSIGHALADSPTGLLSWIAERFHDWTQAATSLKETVDRRDLITNTMIYWLNNTAASSALFYKSSGLYGGGTSTTSVSTVPTAVSNFSNDILISDRELAEVSNQITNWTEHDQGGHFAGLEVPELLADDLIRAFGDDAAR